MKYLCSVCGYVHEGEEPPQKCPNCGAERSFNEIEKDGNPLKIFYGELTDEIDKNSIKMFFGNYKGIQPFIYNLPAGNSVPLHKHPTTDELFFIIKGRFEFRIGNKEVIADKGDFVQGRMNIPHTFKNISDEHGIFLSVKGPKPVDTEIIAKE